MHRPDINQRIGYFDLANFFRFSLPLLTSYKSFRFSIFAATSTFPIVELSMRSPWLKGCFPHFQLPAIEVPQLASRNDLAEHRRTRHAIRREQFVEPAAVLGGRLLE